MKHLTIHNGMPGGVECSGCGEVDTYILDRTDVLFITDNQVNVIEWFHCDECGYGGQMGYGRTIADGEPEPMISKWHMRETGLLESEDD